MQAHKNPHSAWILIKTIWYPYKAQPAASLVKKFPEISPLISPCFWSPSFSSCSRSRLRLKSLQPKPQWDLCWDFAETRSLLAKNAMRVAARSQQDVKFQRQKMRRGIPGEISASEASRQSKTWWDLKARFWWNNNPTGQKHAKMATRWDCLPPKKQQNLGKQIPCTQQGCDLKDLNKTLARSHSCSWHNHYKCHCQISLLC